MAETPLPLNQCHVLKTEMIINRLYMLFLGVALAALCYYRVTEIAQIIKTREYPLLPYALIFISELIFILLWVLHQAFRWRPVTRTAYPERLRENSDEFPNIDIFVCTADPGKEPSLGVMNTVLSAMALDYPSEKLSIYVSDDGGSFVTLEAMRETWRFCKWWLPFCRKYEVKNRCPEAYFSAADRGGVEFVAEQTDIKKRYDKFKEILEKNSVNASSSLSRDHLPIIEVMSDEDGGGLDSSQQAMPLLVYVSREKRPSQPHNFKAGAVNTLIRVSAVISNAPYFLLLDCDHYCNDPTSARQAMCFYLDPKVSPKLAWVQFPQKFHNISEHDLYDCHLSYYRRRWLGFNGIQGPSIAGCNMYMKREAVYGTKNLKSDFDFNEMKKSFGPSNELIKSALKNYKPQLAEGRKITGPLEKEVQLLASCTYDSHSEWGKELGFIYQSVVEDVMTSQHLHCHGWTSVWVDPMRPCFLGSSPTNLSDVLVQQARWGLGLMQIALSKYCALIYGRGKMPALQCMCYAATTIDPISVIPFYGLAIVPQICLLNGIALYPKVSDPYLLVFAFIFVASLVKHAQEVIFIGDSLRTAVYELRMWMMKAASCHLYSTLGAFLDKFGLHKAHFALTSKVVDDQADVRFKMGIYDFQGSAMVIAPICTLYVLNFACFVLGIVRLVHGDGSSELFVQALIPLFGIILNFHVFEGMVLRRDEGRVSRSVCVISVVVATFVLCFGSLLLVW